MRRIAGFTFALLLIAVSAWAQDWRGAGRLMGSVVDEQGKPVEGVIIRAKFPAVLNAILESKSDKKGQWTVDDVGEGDWELTFEKDGYHAGKASSSVDENGRSSPIKTTLKKMFDPNEFIQQEGKKAAALMEQKKYADARAIYESIIGKVPEVAAQMQAFIARAYYLEGNHPKAIEHLKAGLAKDPANVGTKQVLIGVLLEDGATDEAQQLMSGIPEAQIDATIYVNFGIALTKKQKVTEAIQYFEKALAKSPQSPEPYYYRAVATVELVNAEKDPKNAERIERIGRIKADLTKYLQLAPANSPANEEVKKLLEQVEKMMQQK